MIVGRRFSEPQGKDVRQFLMFLNMRSGFPLVRIAVPAVLVFVTDDQPAPPRLSSRVILHSRRKDGMPLLLSDAKVASACL